MRIESRTHESNAFPSQSAHQLNPPLSGLSSTPSSLNMRLHAREDSGSFCSCISRFIERICRFLGLSSSQESTPTTRVSNPAETWTAIGKRILATHFRSDAIVRDQGQRSAIAVIMNYNGRTLVSFGTAAQQKEEHGFRLINDRLEHFIAQGTHVPGDPGLNITTAYFKKNNDGTYAFQSSSDSVLFLSAGALDYSTLTRTIDGWTCSQEEKDQLKISLLRL